MELAISHIAFHPVDLADEASGQPECIICRAGIVKAVDLPCGHFFCRDCITQWVRSNWTCPICRRPSLLHEIRENKAMTHFASQLREAEKTAEAKAKQNKKKVLMPDVTSFLDRAFDLQIRCDEKNHIAQLDHAKKVADEKHRQEGKDREARFRHDKRQRKLKFDLNEIDQKVQFEREEKAVKARVAEEEKKRQAQLAQEEKEYQARLDRKKKAFEARMDRTKELLGEIRKQVDRSVEEYLHNEKAATKDLRVRLVDFHERVLIKDWTTDEYQPCYDDLVPILATAIEGGCRFRLTRNKKSKKVTALSYCLSKIVLGSKS